MGLLRFIYNLCHYREASALIDYELLSKQIAASMTKGLSATEAGARLLAQQWHFPVGDQTFPRAKLLATNLGELVVGFIMFSKRAGVWEAIGNSLKSDPFFEKHGCLYGTSVPLTDLGRKQMNRLWNQQHINPNDLSDAAFAAYYATLVAPIAIDAWIMLAEFRRLGVCPDMDSRDHANEGVQYAETFLERYADADPEFRELLLKGVQQLRGLNNSTSI